MTKDSESRGKMRNTVSDCRSKSQSEQPWLCDTSGLSWKSREVSWREGLGGGEVGITRGVQGWGQGLDLGKSLRTAENHKEAQQGQCLGESVGEEKGSKADREQLSIWRAEAQTKFYLWRKDLLSKEKKKRGLQ